MDFPLAGGTHGLTRNVDKELQLTAHLVYYNYLLCNSSGERSSFILRDGSRKSRNY
jgi:hypothetical protein